MQRHGCIPQVLTVHRVRPKKIRAMQLADNFILHSSSPCGSTTSRSATNAPLQGVRVYARCTRHTNLPGIHRSEKLTDGGIDGNEN